MRVWGVVAVGVVALLVGGCAGDGTAPTAGATPAESALPATAECATESDMGIGTGGSFPFFASVEELVLASDIVVVGTVTSVSCEDAGGIRDRRAVIDIEDTLYGQEVAQLEIVSAGDEHGGPIPIDGVLPPIAGESAVWFLRSSPTVTGTVEPVGPQGRYRIEDQELAPVTQDTDNRRVHQVAEQIAGLGRDGLAREVTAVSQAIAVGDLAHTWTNTHGTDLVRSVHATRGPVHCGWQDMRFLYVDVSAFPPDDPRHHRPYVANPAPEYGQEGWDADVDLPADAVDTGGRRGSTQLWLAADDGSEAAFLVDGATVERLPLDDTGQGCD